jgi:hypothetical protein
VCRSYQIVSLEAKDPLSKLGFGTEIFQFRSKKVAHEYLHPFDSDYNRDVIDDSTNKGHRDIPFRKITICFVVIWEIILRDFWGDILRGYQLESRIILFCRLRLDMSIRHTGSNVFKFISWALYVCMCSCPRT